MTLNQLIRSQNLKAGDKVRCLATHNHMWFRQGEVYVLAEVDYNSLAPVDREYDRNTVIMSNTAYQWELAESAGAMEGYGPWQDYQTGLSLPPNALIERENGHIKRVAAKKPERVHHVRYYQLKGAGCFAHGEQGADLKVEWYTEDGEEVKDSLRTTVLV